MTYREAHEKIRSAGYGRKTDTLVEKMVYMGWEYREEKIDHYGDNFRSWDDEISAADRESLNKRYAQFGLSF